MQRSQIPKGKSSLLRAFLLSMMAIALLFVVLAVGIWIYTSDVLRREETLISQLLPELDAAYQLTATTADLQSQGLQLSVANDQHALAKRRADLNATIEKTRNTIGELHTVSLSRRTDFGLAVDNIAHVASGLADIKQLQLQNQQKIKTEQVYLLETLLKLEKDIQQQVVRLADTLQSFSDSIEMLDAKVLSSPADVQQFSDRLFEFESVNLVVQDYLLVIQDVVSLVAVVERLPLLTSREAVNAAEQGRNLIISALVSRSIYLPDGYSSDVLLPTLRDLRLRLRGDESLFSLQKVVLTQLNDQNALDSLLREHTSRVFSLAEDLRNDSRSTVNKLAVATLQGLNEYRTFLLMISVLTLLVLLGISYWLLYRKTVVPLVQITQQLDDVGSDRFPAVVQSYYLKEFSTLSSAMAQLDDAQKSMQAKDRELLGANQELQRANLELEQFAHIASHDLQEPLRKLQQFSVLLEDDYQSVLDDDGRFFLKTIRSSARRMSELIKDTLAYSRAGSTNQKIERVDLSELITQLRDEMDLAVQDAQAEFEVADLPDVYANSVGMAQLFRNLMLNALKYRKPDTPARVSISVIRSEGADYEPLLIRVEDNGIGIDNQYLERVFQPFERLQSGDVRGTGLGLAICKKVCDSHGWALDISSQVGVGTCFDIRVLAASVA